MPMTKEQIKTAALELEPAERESLAEEILLSIGPADREAIDTTWLAEAHRRYAAYRDGSTTGKPVEQIIDRLRGKARR
jgi:putative addiction module component (TIGR02574 family)